MSNNIKEGDSPSINISKVQEILSSWFHEDAGDVFVVRGTLRFLKQVLNNPETTENIEHTKSIQNKYIDIIDDALDSLTVLDRRRETLASVIVWPQV